MILGALLLVLAQDKPIPSPARPRDPWVFRSVLDERPRMVTIALSADMWVAYDAQTCGLYKAWKGGVRLDGAVYTTVHGPSPTTIGPAYTAGFDGDVWSAEIAGRIAPAKATWKGYRFNGAHVVLQYELLLADGRKVEVRESPEFVRPEEMFDDEHVQGWALPVGHPGLLRSFHAAGVPEDVKLTLKIRTDGVTGKLAELMERESDVEVVDEKGAKSTQSIAHVVLMREKPVNNVILYFAPLPAPEPAKEEKKGSGR